MFISALEDISHSLLCVVGLHKMAGFFLVGGRLVVFLLVSLCYEQEYSLKAFQYSCSSWKGRDWELPLTIDWSCCLHLCGMRSLCMFPSGHRSWLALPVYVLCAFVTEIRNFPSMLFLAISRSRHREKKVSVSYSPGKSQVAKHLLFCRAIIAVCIGNGSVSHNCCPSGSSWAIARLWVFPWDVEGEWKQWHGRTCSLGSEKCKLK